MVGEVSWLYFHHHHLLLILILLSLSICLPTEWTLIFHSFCHSDRSQGHLGTGNLNWEERCLPQTACGQVFVCLVNQWLVREDPAHSGRCHSCACGSRLHKKAVWKGMGLKPSPVSPWFCFRSFFQVPARVLPCVPSMIGCDGNVLTKQTFSFTRCLW